MPMQAALTSPFENAEDIILSGDMKTLVRNVVNFKGGIVEEQDFLGESHVKNTTRDLKEAPNNPFLLNNLGLAYSGKGDMDQALENFKKAFEKNKDFVEAGLNLSDTYVRKGEDEKALKICEELRRKDSKDKRVLLNIGNIYFMRREFGKAERIYKEIVKKDPCNIEARNRKAMFDLIAGKGQEAVSELRKCLQINANLPAIHNNLGIAFGVLGAYKKAILSFKTSLKLYPKYRSAIVNLATAFFHNNQVQEAVELSENYLIENEDQEISEKLAYFYMKEKKPKNAIKNLSCAIKVAIKSKISDQTVARLHNNLGVVYHSMRDYKNAKSNYFISIEEADKLNPMIVGNIIDLFFDMGKKEKAGKYIELFSKEFPEEPFRHYYEAMGHHHNAEPKEAIKSIKKFLKKNNKFAPAYALLSFMYSEILQNYKKAVEVNEGAIKHLPGNRVILNNLAYNYLMNGNLPQAKHILDKTKDIEDNIFLTATRGLLALKENNIQEAQRLYNLASNLTKFENLRKEVLQKKHIELAKYYLSKNDMMSAEQHLQKALSIKTGHNIYRYQVEQLCEQL